ncbi:MAG: hypothetical protein ABJR05_14880 [Balneola sp.]
MNIIKTFLFVSLTLVFGLDSYSQVSNFKIIESGRVVIPDEVFIGEVTFLDKKNQNLLLTDITLGQVLYYDKDDWAKLNPEDCHPGFRFFPIEAHFGDEEIFISNSGIWGFRYTNDAKCIGAAHRDFRAPQRFYSGEKIYGLSNDPNKTIVKEWSSEGKFLNTIYSFDNKFPSAEYRLSLGGILESDGNLYFVNSLEPKIFKIELDTGKKDSKIFEHKSYSEAEKDLPRDIKTPKFMMEAGKLVRTYSMNYRLFNFNKELMTLVVRGDGEGGKFGYHCYFFSKETLKLEGHLQINNRVVYIGEESIVYVNRKNIDEEKEKISLVFNRVLK